MNACFDFYGLTVEVSSAAPELVEAVWRDFAYFRVAPTKGHVQVELHVAPPPYAGLPELPAAFLTPRNVCFQGQQKTYLDYFGRGLAVFDRKAKTFVVHGTDRDLLQEIAYHFVLSTAGQHLDRRGLHRVHALGVSYRNRGILLLLPSGGGKSTMALQLMSRPGFSLLGEETPLIDRRGRVWPLPLRLEVPPETETEIPPKYLRTINRMEFAPKTLIDIDYFRDRLGTTVEVGLILVGQRNLGTVSEIAPLARRRAFKALLKYAVVGLGVYQGLEFVLERSFREVAGKSGVAASRLYNSLVLLARAPAYQFSLGRDIQKNCQTLVDFVRQRLP